MLPYIRRHNPLIATRIEFSPASPPPAATITPRIEFSADRLAYRESEAATREEEHGQASARPQGGEGDVVAGSHSNLSRGSRAGNKIPKPVGEPGRPGSGGYCIETILIQKHQWARQTVLDVNVNVHGHFIHVGGVTDLRTTLSL